jgi:uncharacterized membrane protein YoaK (UPF0700 family)
MMRYDRPVIGLAFCLSGLAGFVDALGFLSLGGFFVSFMSGNTTRFAIELAGHFAGQQRKAAVLAVVTLALLLSAGLDSIGLGMAGAGVLAMAMGAENSVFQRDGEVTIGLTYMTGTLVKMGQRIASALLGGPKLAFLRHLVLWLGLLSGAIAGADAHGRIGLDAIWLAAGAAALFTLVALFMPEPD